MDVEGPVERLQLQVPTIHCDGCVQIIRDALGRFPEISEVKGEPKKKRITVVFHGSLAKDEIVNEISRLGHTVQ